MSHSGSKWQKTWPTTMFTYLICSGSYEEMSDITEHENFFVDEDKEENRLFSDNIEEITSPDLDEPNFNEIKE